MFIYFLDTVMCFLVARLHPLHYNKVKWLARMPTRIPNGLLLILQTYQFDMK